MDKKLEEEFDEVIHNSEVFNVLDEPHKISNDEITSEMRNQTYDYLARHHSMYIIKDGKMKKRDYKSASK